MCLAWLRSWVRVQAGSPSPAALGRPSGAPPCLLSPSLPALRGSGQAFKAIQRKRLCVITIQSTTQVTLSRPRTTN
jgi:hypothetical protein